MNCYRQSYKIDSKELVPIFFFKSSTSIMIIQFHCFGNGKKKCAPVDYISYKHKRTLIKIRIYVYRQLNDD